MGRGSHMLASRPQHGPADSSVYRGATAPGGLGHRRLEKASPRRAPEATVPKRAGQARATGQEARKWIWSVNWESWESSQW